MNSILRGSSWRAESEQALEEMGYEVEWSEGYRYQLVLTQGHEDEAILSEEADAEETH